jgi:hypothetical protein
MRLNFSEMHLTYGITTVRWYTVSEEEKFLADGFITELMKKTRQFLDEDKTMDNIQKHNICNIKLVLGITANPMVKL